MKFYSYDTADFFYLEVMIYALGIFRINAFTFLA